MNIKTIVKVMNFHALIRVDKAHREADQFAMLENEVVHMIDLIQHNRNMILDKWVLKPNLNAPRLRIYLGSDYGFCGAVNSVVNAMLSSENGQNEVIIIGKRIHSKVTPILEFPREEFFIRFSEIENILKEGVHSRKYSGIDLCYDHYYNMSHIEPVARTIFPVELSKNSYENYDEDFSVEGGSVDEILESLIATYLCYECKIAAVNSYAAENILRQAATNESLKRIDEMEQESLWKYRKELNHKAAQKAIDAFVKTKIHTTDDK